MPRRLSVFNPEGEDFVSDRERLSQEDAQRQGALEALGRQVKLASAQQGGVPGVPGGAQDFNDLRNRVVLGREQQQLLDASRGDIERQNIAAQDVGLNTRAELAHRAGIMGAEDARAAFQEGKGIRDARDAFALRALKGLDTSPQAATDQAVGVNSPRFQERLVGSLFGIGEDPDVVNRRNFQQQAQARLNELAFQGATANDPGVRQRGAALLRSQGIDVPSEGLGLKAPDAALNEQAFSLPSVAGPLARAPQDFVRFANEDPQKAAISVLQLMDLAGNEAERRGGDRTQARAEVLNRINQAVPQQSAFKRFLSELTLGVFGDTSGVNEARNLLNLQ